MPLVYKPLQLPVAASAAAALKTAWLCFRSICCGVQCTAMNVAIICKARKGCLWSLLSMSDFARHKLCKVHMASAHGKRVKGSVASVTRFRRPRAVSHQQTLLTAHSSSPLSEPSLKELHTRRAPLGLGRHMQANTTSSKTTATYNC